MVKYAKQSSETELILLGILSYLKHLKLYFAFYNPIILYYTNYFVNYKITFFTKTENYLYYLCIYVPL